jgi:hypothetical protein
MAPNESEMDSMKTDHSNARPPRWAEALLRLLLKPKDRESVSGDLLEQYRDTIVPALGPAADRWYVRQVGSFLVQGSWLWGSFVGGALVIRYLFDTLIPPKDYAMRATILSYTILAAFLLVGFSTSLRTRSIRAGVLTAFTAAVISALLSMAGATVMLAIWHDPAHMEELRNSGGVDEAYIGVPMKMIEIGLVVGLVGALIGKGVAISLPRHEEKSA